MIVVMRCSLLFVLLGLHLHPEVKFTPTDTITAAYTSEECMSLVSCAVVSG